MKADSDRSAKRIKLSMSQSSLDILRCDNCCKLMMSVYSDGDYSVCKKCHYSGEDGSHNEPMTKLVKSLKFDCPNKLCDETPPLFAYEKHLAECKHSGLNCPIGNKTCPWKMIDGMDIDTIIDHLLSHKSDGSAKAPEDDKVGKIVVKMLTPLPLGAKIPKFALPGHGEICTDYYFIVPILEKDGDTRAPEKKSLRHLLFCFTVEGSAETVEMAAMMLPEKHTRYDEIKGDLKIKIYSMEDVVAVDVIKSSDNKSLKDFYNKCSYLPGSLSTPDILAVQVTKGTWMSVGGSHLEMLLSLQRDDGSWKSTDEIFSLWYDIVHTTRYGSLGCVSYDSLEDDFDMKIGKDKDGLFANPIAINEADIRSAVSIGMEKELIGTMTAINVLKIKYAGCGSTMYNYTEALHKAHSFITNLASKFYKMTHDASI
jgi:hypothetical protein